MIEEGDVDPDYLEADIEQTTRLVNQTDATVTVEFTNGGVGPDGSVTSVDIEPGAAYEVVSTYVRSIAYTVGGDSEWAGVIHMDYPRFGEEG